MKKIISISFLFGLLLSSCEKQDIQVKKEKLAKVAYSSLDKEEKLANALKGINVSVNKGGRIMNVLENINSDSILKVLQSDSTSYTFTMRLKNDNSTSFKNLVFRRTLNGFVGFVLEYKASVQLTDLTKFDGNVRKYDLEGKLLGQLAFKNGTITTNSGGRISGCNVAGFSRTCVEQIFDGWDHTTGVPIFKCGRYSVFLTIDCYDFNPENNSYGTFIADYRPAGGGSVTNIQGNFNRNTEYSTFDPGDPMGIWPPPTGDEIFKILTDELVGTLTSVNLLDVQQNDNLKTAFNEVYKKCTNRFFIDALNENGFKFKFKIDASMTTPGGFDPATNSIKFRSTNDINYTTLQEELFHAYQHLTINIQPLLTPPYTGRSNIEFEAKMYSDLVAVRYNQVCCLGGQTNEYTNWLLLLTANGSKFPNWQDMQQKYFYFLEIFKLEKPEYNFPTDNTLLPITLFKPLSNCP
jgi:hypothetical protein